jgi:hypothetical protein
MPVLSNCNGFCLVFCVQNESSHVTLKSAIAFNIGSSANRKQGPLTLYGNRGFWVTPVWSRDASLFIASYDADSYSSDTRHVCWECVRYCRGRVACGHRRVADDLLATNTFPVFFLRCSVNYFSLPWRPIDFFLCTATYLLSVSCLLL